MRRYIPVALVLCVGIVISAALFYMVRERERAAIKVDFERHANTRTAALQKGIERNLEVLESII